MSWSFTLEADFPVQKSYEEGRISSIAKSINVEIESLEFCPISKSDEEGRIVRAVILSPDDETSEDDVRAACYSYMESKNRGQINGEIKILENMLTPADMKINGQELKKSTWIMTLKILDDEMWQAFQTGFFRIAGESVEEI